MGRRAELAVGILNGAIGDYLRRSDNGLATEMTCVEAGAPMPLTPRALAKLQPRPTSKIVVLVHGLMCTEEHWQLADGSNYGSRLARDLGYTPLILRYNSGLAIADNGQALALLLEKLLAAYPLGVEEILLIGFSMGGLVIRSACHVAAREGHGWLERVARAVYIGTPHRGAPLERLARVGIELLRSIPDPYTQLIASLSDLRSDGLKDLGDADLRHEDRARRRPALSLRDPLHPVPLLPEIEHYLAAGALFAEPRLALLFGDVMVPVPSASNGECDSARSLAWPPDHVKVFPGLGHMALARHPDVYEQIKRWCQEER